MAMMVMVVACALQTREQKRFCHFFIVLEANAASFAATNQTMKLYCGDLLCQIQQRLQNRIKRQQEEKQTGGKNM